MDEDVEPVAKHAEDHLNLHGIKLNDDYYYRSLPLCVINAVYSIGARYEGVRAVVSNWCHAQTPAWTLFRNQGGVEQSVSDFIAIAERYSPEELADSHFKNRQRTSTRSGVLKAQAVVEFAKVLKAHKIEVFNNISDSIADSIVEQEIRKIRGQGSGISFEYFLMLSGSDDFVKADRMVQRFVASALGLKEVPADRARQALKGAACSLKPSYPNLTPRALDYAVWSYQRRLRQEPASPPSMC